MSFLREPPTALGHGRLIAEAPPAVDIEVFDANFKQIATGVRRLDLDLQEGLYTVRFIAAGVTEERPVRLLPIAEPLVVRGGHLALESAPPSDAPGASDFERRQAQAFSNLAKPSRDLDEHEIVVFVRAPDERTRSDVSRSLRLLDSHDVDVGVVDASETEQDRVEGWGTRRYQLSPGSYRLRYESSARRMVEQTICVFPGRRTYAFLQYGSSVQIEKSGDELRPVVRRGVDAAQTTIVSSANAEDQPNPEDIRLADLLLHGIRSLQSGIDRALIDTLIQPDSCPFLQLYAAAALTRRLEVTRSGGAERLTEELQPDWMDSRIEALLENLVPGRWPDMQAIGWRLAMLREPPGDAGAILKLRFPPMLDCSWRWAAAFSVDHPDCLPSRGVFEAAASARLAAGPWLVWSSAAARASVTVENEPLFTELAPAVENLTMELRDISERRHRVFISGDSSDVAFSKLLRAMSPNSQEVAAAVIDSDVPGRPWVHSDVHQIASYLGTPARVLGFRLSHALEEVRKLKNDL
jgi:hypothetical protein